MYRNLLVPIDLAPMGRDVLDTIAALAAPPSPQVTLLHVIETVEDTTYEDLRGFYAHLRDRAEKALEGPAEALRERGVAVEVRIVYGRRGPEIVRQAEASGHDLIAMASHRADPEEPARGLWSISHQVAVMAPCSVLMVR